MATARNSGQRYRGRSAGAARPVAVTARNPPSVQAIMKKNSDRPPVSPAGSGRTSRTASGAPCLVATARNSDSIALVTALPDAAATITVAVPPGRAAGT